MLEIHILVILSRHGGNLIGPTFQLWGGYVYILWEVPEDLLMDFLPLGGLMVLEGMVAFLCMVLMVLVVLGGLVAFLLMALEGLVALLLVVPKAPKVYLLGVSKGQAVLLLVVQVVLVVPKVLVVPEALLVLTVLIPEINPPRVDLLVVLHHNNLSINLLMVLLVLICHINITSM